MNKCFNCGKEGNHVKSYITLKAKICELCLTKINDKKHEKKILNKYWKLIGGK